jgi:lysophospholipase L1-like esterase
MEDTPRFVSRSWEAVRTFDRDAVKAVPMVGQLPWHIVLGNTALHATERRVDYFLPAVRDAETQKPDVLFLGDSLSRNWRTAGIETWNKYFAPKRAITLGVSGDRTQHLLFRLKSGVFGNLAPSSVVLQIGTNNINRNTAKEIAEAIELAALEIRSLWPNARQVVAPIPPRESPRTQKVIARVQSTNRHVRQRLADFHNVTVVADQGCFLNADGWINRVLFTPEGIHLSEHGYATLGALIHAVL